MRFAWLAYLGLVACGEPAPRIEAPAPGSAAMMDTAAPRASVAAPAAAPSTADSELDTDIAQMLARVSKVRNLAAKQPVEGERLGRKKVIELIMAKTEKELPKGVLEAQGELLRGFGLIEPDYDFVGGIYALIEENLAGFYDQHVDKMFILDDLPEAAVEETLAHELVHALQDQHFDLTGLLDYQPGDSDRVTAGHALAEGDAMSAMFELTMGDARKISVSQLRVAMVASVAFSGSGGKTPRVLQASLIAPYIDGFRFVQDLRAGGGWKAVDDAYARLPASTEQLLHVDKFLANEKPLVLKPPALPGGFEREDQDVLGEQGLRMVLEQWTSNSLAAEGAAGWGGDRFAVGSKDTPTGTQWAAAWIIRFDAANDAEEAAAILKKRHRQACVKRTDLGPLAWQRNARDLAIVAGPFTKSDDGALQAASTCGAARQWLAKLL